MTAIPGQPGTLDASWATLSPLGAGKVITQIGVGAFASPDAMVLQPDGKVVLAGSCSAVFYSDVCALRYNADGTLDASFGTGGKVITSFASNGNGISAIAIQPDGRLVLAGTCAIGGNNDFCALRYNVDGALDGLFGSAGIVTSPIGSGTDSARGLALQPDGKLILAGFCAGISHYEFCASRHNNDGSLDTSFNGSGTTITPVGTGAASAFAVTIQPDGKLVLAGSCVGATNSDFCLLRYNANGSLDLSFGPGGKAITPVGGGDDFARAIVLQPDGKLVLAGDCVGASNVDFCAVRYNSNGSVDTSFGASGKIIAPVGAGDDYAIALGLQSDGKLILAGYCAGASNRDFCAVRYNGNGTLDTSFNTTGRVITPVGAGDDVAQAFALQPDGKLLLAGMCAGDTTYDFCAIRYDGGPFGYKNCSLDIDGDNRVLAMTDSLIHTRIALGITGPAVVNGITFPPTATRNIWPLIRDYLVTQCGMSLVQ